MLPADGNPRPGRLAAASTIESTEMKGTAGEAMASAALVMPQTADVIAHAGAKMLHGDGKCRMYFARSRLGTVRPSQ